MQDILDYVCTYWMSDMIIFCALFYDFVYLIQWYRLAIYISHTTMQSTCEIQLSVFICQLLFLSYFCAFNVLCTFSVTNKIIYKGQGHQRSLKCFSSLFLCKIMACHSHIFRTEDTKQGIKMLITLYYF